MSGSDVDNDAAMARGRPSTGRLIVRVTVKSTNRLTHQFGRSHIAANRP